MLCGIIIDYMCVNPCVASLPPSPLDPDDTSNSMVTAGLKRDSPRPAEAGLEISSPGSGQSTPPIHPHSPNDMMPVKKRRRGRRNFAEVCIYPGARHGSTHQTYFISIDLLHIQYFPHTHAYSGCH